MGSPLRIFLGLIVLWLLGHWVGQLGWSGPPGFQLAQELQRSRALEAGWVQAQRREAVADRILHRLLLGQLGLRQAVRDLRALSNRPPREEISEVCLAGNLVELLAGDPLPTLPNRDEVLEKLRRELTEMQQAGP